MVQQIVRQISEKELGESLPEDKTVLKHLHNCGPEIEGRPDLLLLAVHIMPVTEYIRETAVS